VLLAHHLKKLKLPTMLREHAAVAAACTTDKADYGTYLLRLLSITNNRRILDTQPIYRSKPWQLV